MDALQRGPLRWVLDRVQQDRTLCLEIRNEYINVYYRGGNLMKVSPGAGADQSYQVYFNPEYLAAGSDRDLPGRTDLPGWQAAVPTLKDAMDLWMGRHPTLEREFQQEVVRVNNTSDESSTDYFICDLEYAVGRSEFDMIGVLWPSTSSARKKDTDLRLTFIEMKFGDGAVEGDHGLAAHLEDIERFIEQPGAVARLADEMKGVFNQKLELGLIRCKKPIVSFHEVPEIMLLLADHDPDKTALTGELPRCQPIVQRLHERHGVRTLGAGLFVAATLPGSPRSHARAVARLLPRCDGLVCLPAEPESLLCAAHNLLDGLFIHGIIGYDLDGLLTVLRGGDVFALGLGRAPHAAVLDAADQALLALQRQGVDLSRICSVNLGLNGDGDTTLAQISDLYDRVRSRLPGSADILFYSTIRDDLSGRVEVSLLAAEKRRPAWS